MASQLCVRYACGYVHVHVLYVHKVQVLLSKMENPAVSQSVSGVFNTTGDVAGSVALTVTNTVSQTHQQSNPEALIIVVGADDTVDVEVSGYFSIIILKYSG